MDDTLRIAQVAVTVVLTIGALCAIYVGTKLGLKRAARTDRDLPRADDARLQRIEQAVESIAIEVERISEAQRFTAKVLAERLPDRVHELASGSPPPR